MLLSYFVLSLLFVLCFKSLFSDTHKKECNLLQKLEIISILFEMFPIKYPITIFYRFHTLSTLYYAFIRCLCFIMLSICFYDASISLSYAFKRIQTLSNALKRAQTLSYAFSYTFIPLHTVSYAFIHFHMLLYTALEQKEFVGTRRRRRRDDAGSLYNRLLLRGSR